MNIFVRFILTVLFLLALYKIPTLLSKSGLFLNRKIAPIYSSIKSLLSPYKGSGFYESVLNNSQKLLKSWLSNTYFYFIPAEKETRNILFNSPSYEEIECFSLLYLSTYFWEDAHPISPLGPNKKEGHALSSLQKYCQNALKRHTVPEPFKDFFEYVERCNEETLKSYGITVKK